MNRMTSDQDNLTFPTPKVTAVRGELLMQNHEGAFDFDAFES